MRVWLNKQKQKKRTKQKTKEKKRKEKHTSALRVGNWFEWEVKECNINMK